MIACVPAIAHARDFTLADAIAYARHHQPALAATRAELAARRLDAHAVEGAWLPRVGATAQLFAATANNTTGADVGVQDVALYRISSTPATSSTSWHPEASTLVGIGASQEVFDFGRISARRAIADADVSRATDDVRARELDLERDVEIAFYGTEAAKAVVASAEAADRRATVHLQLAQDGVRVGMRPVIEVKRATADLARAHVALVRAKDNLAEARVTLATAIGDIDEEVDTIAPTTTLPPLPALGDALARARAASPVLAAARAELDRARARTHELATRLHPSLFVTASLFGMAGGATPSSGESPSGDGWVPSVANWDVGLVLSWPVFDATVSRSEDAARVDELARTSDIAAIDQATTGAVRDALIAAQTADSTIASLQESADAARANDDEAEARFTNGVGTSVELADAEALRTDAEIQLAVGTFDQQRTRAVLAHALAQEIP
ncbi:MAG: TolC family protein [Kofleriaceae bacterium]